MFDWVAALRVQERSRRRVVLGLARATRMGGALLVLLGLIAAVRLWSVWSGLAFLGFVACGLGLIVLTLQRQFVFDADDGTLRVEQGLFGLRQTTVVPLFHLRAVVVVAHPVTTRRRAPSGFVAYVERRVGTPIFLDESRRCARLLRIAEAVAEVADVRLEYDATGATVAR